MLAAKLPEPALQVKLFPPNVKTKELADANPPKTILLSVVVVPMQKIAWLPVVKLVILTQNVIVKDIELTVYAVGVLAFDARKPVPAATELSACVPSCLLVAS